jgi:hypothetical protein
VIAPGTEITWRAAWRCGLCGWRTVSPPGHPQALSVAMSRHNRLQHPGQWTRRGGRWTWTDPAEGVWRVFRVVRPPLGDARGGCLGVPSAQKGRTRHDER